MAQDLSTTGCKPAPWRCPEGRKTATRSKTACILQLQKSGPISTARPSAMQREVTKTKWRSVTPPRGMPYSTKPTACNNEEAARRGPGATTGRAAGRIAMMQTESRRRGRRRWTVIRLETPLGDAPPPDLHALPRNAATQNPSKSTSVWKQARDRALRAYSVAQPGQVALRLRQILPRCGQAEQAQHSSGSQPLSV